MEDLERHASGRTQTSEIVHIVGQARFNPILRPLLVSE
jgi:hypothetical protein